MKHDSPVHLAMDGLYILRKNGLKILSDPLAAIVKYRQIASFKDICSIMKSLDYSTEDFIMNTQLMTRFRKIGTLQIQTINWFVPYFEHAYAGIHTILRFASYFHEKKGVKNRLIIYGNPLATAKDVRDKVANVFPQLQIDKTVMLASNNLSSVPEADVCIATLWTSAYHVLKFQKTRGKFYFVQDYEPLSFPAGTMYGLAEATYRFGFYGIVNTPGLYELFVRDYGSNAICFIPPVNKNIFYPSERGSLKQSEQSPFTIFFYARPDRQHNAFELGISALHAIKKRYGEQVRILTAGFGWDPKSYGLEEDLIDLGTLPYRKTASLYRECDLGIVFSYSKHPSYIPFELMACGCPVLTNYNPATAWLFKDGQNCIVTNPSLSSICEKINMLVSNPELRQQIATNALASLPKTDWDTEIERIYDFMSNPNSASARANVNLGG